LKKLEDITVAVDHERFQVLAAVLLKVQVLWLCDTLYFSETEVTVVLQNAGNCTCNDRRPEFSSTELGKLRISPCFRLFKTQGSAKSTFFCK
jgi:hypothetical protein